MVHDQTTHTVDSNKTDTSNYVIEYGDRVQFCVDANNSTAEFVYIKHNNRAAFATKSGITIDDVANKGYYMATDNTEKWRISRNPNRYLGDIVTGTYILNI